MLDQRDYRAQLDEFLKRQRAATGQGRIDASKLGAQDDEVRPVEPGAMPEPTGFLKFLQPVADVLGRYTRPIAGLAETVFGKATKEIVRFKAGDQVADEYEAERNRILSEREARAEALGGGLGGFLGAAGETLDEMSNLKDRRPELFPFEKFVEDMLVDPTTYMGFGLGTALGKLPHVGKLFKPLELVLDVAPQRAWKESFGRAGKAVRGAIEASEPIGGIKARLFTETARSKATRAADDIRTQWHRFIGAKDVLDDELLNKSARAGLDALMTLAQDGGKIELPEAVAVLKTLHQGNEQEALGAAGRLLTTFDDMTEIEKLKYMTVGQVGNWLAAHTYGSVRKLFDARLVEMKAQSAWATKASLMLMEPSANRPMGWAYRWFVMEPARAVLSFANYGPFNVIEDILRIAESGTAVDVLDKLGLDWATAGFGAPGFIAGKRVSELALVGQQGVEEVPSLLSWYKGWPGKPLAWWNAKASRYSEALRRGAVVNHWRDDMMKSVAANPALMTPELRQALDDIPRMLPGIPKQMRHTAQTVATILALRGEYDALRMLPTMFSRQALNIQKADDIIAALPKNLPLSAKNVVREAIKTEGFAAVSTPEKQKLLYEKMLDAVEKDLPLDPKYVGESIDEMLAAGEAADPKDLALHIEKILGAGLPRWTKWDGIMRDLLKARGSKYHMGQQHAWFSDAMKGGADRALEQSKRLRVLIEKTPSESFFALESSEKLRPFLHTMEQLRQAASGQGVLKLYHGAPKEHAEKLVAEGARTSYNVEALARRVAVEYGLDWKEFSRYAYRKGEKVKELSTAPAPIASRWAQHFPEGEVLSDLNEHARFLVEAKRRAKDLGIKTTDALEQVMKEAPEQARKMGKTPADALGLPDKFKLSGRGALVELEVDIAGQERLQAVAQDLLDEVSRGTLSEEDALQLWHHEYKDIKVQRESVKSSRIVLSDIPMEGKPGPDLRQAQLDALKAFETPWQTHSSFVRDLVVRFFPPDKTARELGLSTGVKGLKTWTPIMNDIALGKIERIGELPKEWGASIIRQVPEWIQLRDAGQLDTKGIVANIEREGYQALYDTKALVASEQLGMNVFEKLLNKLARIGATQGDAAIGPQVREMLERIAKEADEAVLPAVDRNSTMWTESVKDIESIIDELYSGLRKDAISVQQETAMGAYFNGLADTIAKIPDETRKAMSDNALRSWKDSQNWFHDIFPNYSHETTFDAAMKIADPFWIYQSRSWPYLIGAMARKPSLAVGLLPGGRYWEATEEGYIPVAVGGLQFSPIRGSVLGRLRRLQRGAYPPKNDPNGPFPERLLGQWEAGTELAASLGFFPGLVVSTASEAILGFAGGGDIGDVPEKFVENLPAAIATVADGIIAASRIAGPEWTNKLAGTIFKSRYNDYYMTKALWDMHQVSPSKARADGHEDWIADAYHGVALRGMLEEQISLTRFQPDSWKAIQDKVAKVTQDITGVTPEEQADIKRRGRKLSEVVSLDRADRAKLSMIEGIDALAEASVPLSDKERRRYLEASQDYYKTLETFRKESLKEQAADDAHLEAVEMLPDEWRRRYSDRWSEYRNMAQNATKFVYFRKLGGTAEERHAIREKFGMASMFASPVDDVLDRMFAMPPPVNYLGNEDWDALFQAQDELIDTLPVEDARKVRDYLKRNLTPTVQEFREGRRIAAPYKHPEKYVPAWYRSMGREDMAQMIEQAYLDLDEEEKKRQQMLLQGISPPPGRRAQLASFLNQHANEYKYRVAFVPGTPGYSPDILPFIRKFYGQIGPRA